MSGEQVVYHDVPSPRPPPPPQIPSGAAPEIRDEPPAKKKCGFLTKFIIVTLVICLIVFLAVGFSPVGRFSAGNKGEPDSATEGVTFTYEPTYFPTYVPTYVPTYSPTPGADDDAAAAAVVTTTVAATQAAAVTTTVATEGDEDGNATATDEAPLDLSWIDELGNSTTNITDANNVTSTTNATEATVITTEMTTTTTTTTPAIICNLQIQYEIKSPNATYALTSKSDNTTTIFPVEPNEFDGVEEWLYIDQEFEVELCVEAGEYELTMSEGVCIGGTLRDKLIFYQCAAGSFEVTIE